MTTRTTSGQTGPATSFSDWLAEHFDNWRLETDPDRSVWDLAHVRYLIGRVSSLPDNGRLMIFLPPRSYKSELVTVRFTAWMLEMWPRTMAMLACYNQALADKFSVKVRRIVRDTVGLAGSKNVRDWETANGGSVRAVGVGSGATGFGAHWLAIDDPIKNREEANSAAYRDRVWNWWKDDLYTRLDPGARVVLTVTRWHEDDLAGRILEEDEEDEWQVVRLPGIAETQAQRDEWAERHHRPLGEADPLGRAPGEPLVPERFDLEALEKQKRTLGRSFYALIQQTPQELEGGMFSREDWMEIDEDDLPPMVHMCRYWDKAATEDGGKRTAGCLMGRDARGLFYILDIVKGQWGSTQRDEIIRETADADAEKWHNRHIWVEQEPGSSGKDSAEISMIDLAMYVVEADRVTGDKVTRAEPLETAVGNGLVYLVRAAWNRDFTIEAAEFPNGTFKDQVDATSGAYNKIAALPLIRKKPGRTAVLKLPRRKAGRVKRKARR